MAPTRMTLAGVLKGVRLRGVLAGEWAELTVEGLEYDSRKVEKDTLFFAFAGARVDGRQFAREAEARGACAVVSELPRSEDLATSGAIPWIEVEHGRKALAIAARNFYAQPDERVHFTGITGTNGKTTTAYLTDAILRRAGGPTAAPKALTAMIGTIEYRIGDEIRKAPNTTPESLDVIRLAAELEQRGGRYLTMEVSSHGLALARVYGMQFHTAVFTNLTRDHLDFHQTMEDYAAAKRLLFAPDEGPAPQWAILNADDPASESMLPPGDARVIRYGIAEGADLRAENIRSGFDGLHFDAVYQGQRQAIESSLVGRINVSNILAAVGVGSQLRHGSGRDRRGHSDVSAGSGTLRAGRRRAAFSGGGGLRAHRRRAAQCDPVGSRVGGAGRQRPRHHAIRMRRRPGSHQTSVDGNGRGGGQRFRGADVG